MSQSGAPRGSLHFLSLFFFLLICAGTTSAQSLYDVLVSNGLTEFAEFDRRFPSPIDDITGRTVFAPTNEAMRVYLGSSGNTSTSLLAREVDPIKQAEAKDDQQSPSPCSIPIPLEDKKKKRAPASIGVLGEIVISTGLNATNPRGNKVASFPGSNGVVGVPASYFAEVVAGAGSVAFVLRSNIPFDKGIIHVTDRYVGFDHMIYILGVQKRLN